MQHRTEPCTMVIGPRTSGTFWCVKCFTRDLITRDFPTQSNQTKSQETIKTSARKKNIYRECLKRTQYPWGTLNNDDERRRIAVITINSRKMNSFLFLLHSVKLQNLRLISRRKAKRLQNQVTSCCLLLKKLSKRRSRDERGFYFRVLLLVIGDATLLLVVFGFLLHGGTSFGSPV